MFPEPPIRMDLFSIVILLGIVQGILLSYFFISNSKGNRLPNLLLGILLLGLSLIITDVWLGYTNYMFKVVWLVDTTEPINLLLAPLTYLYIKKVIDNQAFKNQDWLHFIPFGIYLIYMALLIYPQSAEYKYNANVDAFHPEMSRISADMYGEHWMFLLKRHIGDFTFLSMLSYDVAVFVMLKKAYDKIGYSFFTREKTALSWYRRFHLQLVALVVAFLIIRISFNSDLGDHIIAALITLIIYATSLTVFSRSMFFQENNTKVVKKYEKSSLTEELQTSTLKKLEEIMKTEKPFLDAGFSLPALAKRLGISTHHLSQILNEELGQTFFDFLASHRIAEAKVLLCAEDSSYIKIEEIAQMVGYNSKSAFNTAFRKNTGLTPSEFKKQSVK